MNFGAAIHGPLRLKYARVASTVQYLLVPAHIQRECWLVEGMLLQTWLACEGVTLTTSTEQIGIIMFPSRTPNLF
jgi:hypothetical protein